MWLGRMPKHLFPSSQSEGQLKNLNAERAQDSHRRQRNQTIETMRFFLPGHGPALVFVTVSSSHCDLALHGAVPGRLRASQHFAILSETVAWCFRHRLRGFRRRSFARMMVR